MGENAPTKPAPGQVWETSAMSICVLSIGKGGSVRFVTDLHPEQSLHESDFMAWIRAIRPTLQGSAPPACPTRERQITAALTRARTLIAGIRETDFECFTVGRVASTMDEDEAAIIAEYDAVLAEIDGALNG